MYVSLNVNLSVFKTITRINEPKSLTKHILCECKCKFDGNKCNSNQNWNNDKCRCECKIREKHHMCKKTYILESCYMYLRKW